MYPSGHGGPGSKNTSMDLGAGNTGNDNTMFACV